MPSHANYLHDNREWWPYIEKSDFTDVKVYKGNVSLRQFIASMLSYYPPWLILLYRTRKLLAGILGLVNHPEPDKLPNLQPAEVSFNPGEKVTFFEVRCAKEDTYWISETPQDKHLKAYFGVAAEPLTNTIHRFYVVTTVYYIHWTGPVYFNLIRPFHHLVVSRMAHAGLKNRPGRTTKTALN